MFFPYSSKCSPPVPSHSVSTVDLNQENSPVYILLSGHVVIVFHPFTLYKFLQLHLWTHVQQELSNSV
jgi:hypothetical protein